MSADDAVTASDAFAKALNLVSASLLQQSKLFADVSSIISGVKPDSSQESLASVMKTLGSLQTAVKKQNKKQKKVVDGEPEKKRKMCVESGRVCGFVRDANH